MDFDDVTCDVSPPNANYFLDIVASDVSPGLDDPAFLEEWFISTGGGSKTGCLIKAGRGRRNAEFIGNFDLSFGYTVCILANPDAGDGVCF